MTTSADAAEPPRFPMLPCPGGWELGGPVEAGPEHLVSMSEFHQLVGSNRRAMYALRKRDGGIWAPDPAVLIGDIGGWYREDIIAWGLDTGRLLDSDGTINTTRKGKSVSRLDRPLKRWRRRTRVYLSTTDIGVALGMQSGVGVTFLGRRGRMMDPDVVTGKIKGWSAERGQRFAAQTSRPWNLPAYIVAALAEQEADR